MPTYFHSMCVDYIYIYIYCAKKESSRLLSTSILFSFTQNVHVFILKNNLKKKNNNNNNHIYRFLTGPGASERVGAGPGRDCIG